MMKVQEYLREHGLQKLQDEFAIMVNEYENRVVLNYDQINSPTFDPICCECRGLILRKSDWSVMSRAFDRFFNVGQGEAWQNFDMPNARIFEKLDGSILSLYWDGEKWCSATRKMAFGEGATYSGVTFAELFMQAKKNTNIDEVFLEESPNVSKNFTWIFELTGPANRVVKPYPEMGITLLGARHTWTGRELTDGELELSARKMGVPRPMSYEAKTIDEVVALAEALPTMDEGFVLVVENKDGSHARLKCKNSSHVAIAHLRDNGGIPTAKNVLHLVMTGEHNEYLQYFPEDQKVFDFVESELDKTTKDILFTWDAAFDLAEQKDFAIRINDLVKHKFEAGILFKIRKLNLKSPSDLYGTVMFAVMDALNNLGAKKLAKALNLKGKMAEHMGWTVSEDDDE